MSHIIVSTQIRFEVGPTYCGDEESDPELMNYLEAELVRESGNMFQVYVSQSSPRIVLDKLAARGYQVVSTSGAGQTCIWTLFKPNNN
jgi:hypothetical protein